MIEPATRQASAAASRDGYRERLWTPWWWYPAGMVVGVLLGAEFVFVVPTWLSWLPIVLSLLGSVLVVWRISSAKVVVRDGQLIAGDRSLALTEIVQAIDLTETELRRVDGRHGDPLAFNFIRGWVGPGVQLVLAQPELVEDVEEDYDEDAPLPRLPEPYWLVSSRHPRKLITAIDAAVS